MDGCHEMSTDFIAHTFQERRALGGSTLCGIEMFLDEVMHTFLKALVQQTAYPLRTCH
jgi:hypothetical protein